ncbi:MAG: Cgl0159 family (beta/alpha)8-fold protein [Solirubrobacteraceae bacterium]
MSASEVSERSRAPISEEAFAQLRRTRQHDPAAISAAFTSRQRRPLVDGDDRIFIVAADHPARGSLGVREEPLAMASRYELLQRLGVALARPDVDGVLATPDIMDDLALLGMLDNKIAVGSMNRGGLRGAVFEMDDRYTGYDVDAMVAARIDVAKVLVRVDLQDARTVRTLEETARAVTQAATAKLPIMLEPFMSRMVDGKVVNDLSTEAVIKSVAITSGLGTSSAYSWLKLPVVDGMERVMEATTLPTLLLGGDSGDDPDQLYSSWQSALALPGVHGLVAGRSLLYPADDDVARAVDTAAALVHGG